MRSATKVTWQRSKPSEMKWAMQMYFLPMINPVRRDYIATRTDRRKEMTRKAATRNEEARAQNTTGIIRLKDRKVRKASPNHVLAIIWDLQSYKTLSITTQMAWKTHQISRNYFRKSIMIKMSWQT